MERVRRRVKAEEPIGTLAGASISFRNDNPEVARGLHKRDAGAALPHGWRCRRGATDAGTATARQTLDTLVLFSFLSTATRIRGAGAAVRTERVAVFPEPWARRSLGTEGTYNVLRM